MKPRRIAHVAALLGPLVLGSATAATPAGEAPSAARVYACDGLDRRTAPVGVLVNNQWNRASAGAGPWRQCLQQRTRNGVVEDGWTWQWPETDGLYAYPELLVGRSPWFATPTNDDRFPRTVAGTRRLVIDYDVELSGAGKRNLAVEFWFTRTPLAAGQPDPRTIRTELMIWTEASPGLVWPDEPPVATVEIDGAAWRVHVKRDWGDVSGGSGHRWSFITYHAVKPTTRIRYDARTFIQDAVQRGVVAPTDTIAGVEIGNEIVSGSGSTWLRRFALEIE